jgi:hypothetical protein
MHHPAQEGQKHTAARQKRPVPSVLNECQALELAQLLLPD